MLYQWARYYKNIYEMMPNERPAQNIIDNDAELDAWQIQYTRDLARSLSSNRTPDIFGGNTAEKIPKFEPPNA